MVSLAYTVAAVLPDEPTARDYVAWLTDGHVDSVLKAGAHSCMVVRMIDPAHPIRVEARYIFPNRHVFETYLAQHAPGLRNEGLKRFPASLGIQFERTVGHVF
jgi:hypothetical protein